MKWKSGFSCRKCSGKRSGRGSHRAGKRCLECGYDESPTAHTLFHKVKFGIDKAFAMVYDILIHKKGSSSIWLGEKYGVKQQTAWLFRRKVQQALASSELYPLEGDVHVDEFEIGGPQKGEPGRSKSVKKSRIVIAVEDREGQAGKAYALQVYDFSTNSLRTIFDQHISKEAKVLTDGCKGYLPLQKEFKIEQELSDGGKNFPMLHIQIRNFKTWIRGVHSYCGKQNVQDYLNEYFFRFNRRNHRKSIIERFIDRAMLIGHVPYDSLKKHAA